MSRRANAARDTDLNTLCAIFDLLHDAVIIADADGHIRYANTSAGHLFGYDATELHSRSLNDLVPARFRRRHERVVREFTQTGQPRLMGERPALQALSRSGEEIPISVSLCSVNADGERLAVAVIRNLAALSSQIDAARALAETDSLTGLGNRLHLTHHLGRLIDAADSRFALLYLDLDRFKAVNDEHGHVCGDRVLKIVAARLKGAIRDRDIVVRVGGDEFVVILTGVSEDGDVGRIAGKLARAVEQRFNAKGVRGSVGASIGWVLYPRDGRTESELLRVADARMYEQKAARRQPTAPR